MAGKRKPGASTIEPVAAVIVDESHHIVDCDRWGKILGDRSPAPAVSLMGFTTERRVPRFDSDGRRA